jgi:hypothetical protein
VRKAAAAVATTQQETLPTVIPVESQGHILIKYNQFESLIFHFHYLNYTSLLKLFKKMMVT